VSTALTSLFPFRQTETIRRQRINAAVDGLREQTALPPQVDQATVLEQALALIMHLKEQIAMASVQGEPSPKRAMHYAFEAQDRAPSSSPSELSESSLATPADSLDALDLTSLDMDVGSFIAELTTAHQAPAAQPSQPWASLTTQPALTDGSSPAYKVSLDSMFLPLNVGLFIFNNTGHILDCNQATLTLGGATSLNEYNTHRTWLESKLVVEVDVDVAAFDQLKQTGIVSTHQLSRKLDGTVQWSRCIASRMGDHSTTSDVNTTYFGICQLAGAPSDGRSRVWTNDHLVHVGLSQHPKFHPMNSMVEV
jgi:PAS domain-containing protein